ncbi:hypothetical protein [Paenibacillus sp. S150]|uniref:hypothetical protein n=1 Tax=Paenibacillus sp. S150 TaxID=2749826 RepID=UPI001C56DFC8|nr:hypothetical protein [Paenibacillus sp. S150]MBW4083065.1 hypothetical protein [Paenibacillus sp. S150]
MKLFQIRTQPLGVERIKEFVEDNYICIGYTGVGDLENAGREDIRERLALARAAGGPELEAVLDNLDIFIHGMHDGDYVLIADEEWAYLGDLGDYFYVEAFDSPEDGRCHRRGVTWLRSVPLSELNPLLASWMSAGAVISQYTGALPGARLELWLTGSAAEGRSTGHRAAQVDEQTLAEALAVLKAALYSGDAERRERAAIAILQYAK